MTGTRADLQPLLLALGFMLAVTLWRTIWLKFDATDLFIDESQYWLWGQRLDLGYYSKPPLIGWVIRVVTDLAGSDDKFWVRFPAAWSHLTTGLGVMVLARALADLRVAAWAGALWITLPGVAVGSAIFSTDTILLPFCALGLYTWVRLSERSSVGYAMLLGIALGLGALAKYAAFFLVPPAMLAVLLLPSFRIAWRDSLIAVLIAAVIFAPNIWWNLTHGLTTVRHTADNASWATADFDLAGAAEFVAGQFAGMGPLAFALFIAAVFRTDDRVRRFLVMFSVPVILFITLQAFISKANANWAAPAYVAATVLVALSLPRRWLAAAVGINLVLSLILPVVIANADRIRGPEGAPILARYLGVAALSNDIFSRAEALRLDTIVTDQRALAADLHYRRADRDVTLLSAQRAGFAKSYYEQEFPVVTDERITALWITFSAHPLCLPRDLSGDPVFTIPQDEGFRAGKTLTGYVAPLVCETEG